MRRHKLFILIVLSFTVVMVSGVATAVSALVQSESVAACCSADARDTGEGQETPCSAPDCPCLSCSVVDCSTTMSVLAYSGAELPVEFVAPDRILPPGFVKAIEYPPEPA